MFEVLLVDDEALARNDVKGMLDWEKHGFTICGEAQNGAIALSMMEQHTPHIAIVDVSMPAMNGVELSRRIKEQFPMVKMIMLSSFDDFDYVRTCLMNGAMDYLLKHRLNASALLALLDRAVMELQSEAREHKARSVQTQIIESLSPVILREHVANLARNVEGAEESLQAYAKDNDLYTHSVNYGTAAVQIVPFLLVTELLNDVQKNRFVQQATDVMQMAIGDVQKRTVGYVGEGRFIILFSSEERSELAVTSQINQAVSALSHSLEKFLNLKCVCIIGPRSGSLKQLVASYRKADQEMNDILYQGMHPATLRDALIIEEKKQLLLYLEQLDGDRIRHTITTIFATVKHQPIYAMTVQTIVSELLRLIEMSLKRQFSHIAREDVQLVPTRNEFGRMSSVSEIEMWVLSYYARIVDFIKEQQAGGSYSRHIGKAVQYISDNYAANISLESTAGALNLNPSYLSRLFKEETQMTFTEYINRVRIKKSCMLMESDAYALKQISSEVGFLSYTYFFKVFKSITGMTPQAYIDHLKTSKK
ncbi:response regulator [Paenibacillus sp. CGMCC 1.16610]|uniref:Response regulator n=1 Tax=Paenibacillus anseongense TaxID=2682845 RepID=A0ABW9UL58_9BACL|nr:MULTISPECIES: response regulator [Paenibacillus]MBA2941214.1 response regulator [Paenibacillus sp. CGMCC 1.16610]MVQ40034.1 response regulator [Paenibacillus anseongense]